MDTSHVVGLRDRAAIGIMIHTAARVGAVARLRIKDFRFDGSQWALCFREKGGKHREIPVRADLEAFLLEFLDAADLRDAAPAGVGPWNATRALDYLESRSEVDRGRIGVTGRSEAGAYTGWIAALGNASFSPPAQSRSGESFPPSP